MTHFFQKLFSTDFMPHVYCLRALGLIWLHAVSDGLIAIAYFLIPFALVRLVQRRRDIEFHWLFILFATFIVSCGATHVLAIVTLWTPVYRLDGLVKAITAFASLLTAGLLMPLVPKISALPSPSQWREANQTLTNEIAQRKKAEAAMLSLNANLERRVEERTGELEETNRRLRELTAAWDMAHGLIRDWRGPITFWCKGNEQLYGWTKEEAAGKHLFELLHTEFLTPLATIEQELADHGAWSGELIHSNKSGARLHVAAHWILQRDEAGAPVSVIEVDNDITDRRRAEEATRRLADLVESSDDAVIAADLDGIVTSWNGGAEHLLGYSAAEIVGQPLDRLNPEHASAGELSILERARAGASSKHYETVRLTKNNKLVTVSLAVSPIRNSNGEVIGTSHILHDISEAKSREEAFRLSEERQRLAVEAGQVGLWYLDAVGGRGMWTQRCKELHGLSAERAVPDYPDLLSLIHLEDREAARLAFSQTLAGNAGLAIEYRTRGVDFRTRWLQVKGQAHRDASGTVLGIHGTVIDLTLRKDMEQKLRRVNTDLDQFTYAAAHDLQEPLRNVALAASLLKIENNPRGVLEQRQLLSTAVESARRMEAMVKDLLAYSHALDSDDQAMNADVSATFSKVLQNLQGIVQEKRAEVVTGPLPARVSMRESHLFQIVKNLLGNALRYAAVSPLKISFSAKVRSADVLFSVKDNGVGIDPRFHARAFGMFKRLHDGVTGGTGIGLAVCKRIVEHYGGSIWIESERGEGTALFFTIPILNDLEVWP